MLIFGVLYCLVSGYDFDKAILVCILIICRIAESISDVFYGTLQKRGKLYISGVSMTIRAILSILVFYFSLSLFHNLLLSCVLLSVASYIPIILIDLPYAGREDSILPVFNCRKIMEILRICFPIFAASILPIIVINLPKYVIDRTMASEFQTIYGIIVLPGTAIILFSQIITQSLLVKLAHYRSINQMRHFMILIIKIISCVVAFTALCILFFQMFGGDLMSSLAGIDMKPYIPLFQIVLVGAMFCSIAIVLSVALTTLRITRVQLYLFLINLITAAGISVYLIPQNGLRGAADSYVLIMFAQLILYAAVFVRASLHSYRRNHMI
jgi:O-antigen/teichoic acid export membrane protein